MKLTKIIAVAGLAVLVSLGTSCQSKKAKEAEKAAAEAAAKAAAEKAAAEAAAKAARVFTLSDAVTAVKGELSAEDAESYKQAVKDVIAQTPYGSQTFALPTASVTYASERCDLNKGTKELLQEFLNVYNSTDKKAVILIEPYADDTSDKEYNKAIAIERANLVRSWLYAYQVPARKVKVVCPCKATKIDTGKQRVNVSIAE